MNEFYWFYQRTRFHGINWIPENFGRVMIVVHGIGEHIGRYDHVAAFFMKEGYLVIGIDHYGHGKSDGTKGATKGFEFMFDYLQSFVRHVEDTYHKPVVMYGHSMGGGVLTGFLLRRQPEILAAVISAPALIIGMRPGGFLKGVLKVASAIAPNIRIKQGLDINKISHDKTEVEKFRADPLRHDKLSLRLANDMIQNGAWCLLHAAELCVPSLLIHGNADEFTAVEGSRLFAERAPSALLTYREWEGMYHEMHNEPASREVLLFIAGWLSNVR
ncbi:alpha/beta hydrolase [Chitinophaga ginsengisegetis]|uniref:alpha/beta hydrolase n=1 Tax=Chitinophaga ginsengisegetis TaxID=393003 RepID=UPI000DB99EAD|nr:alpha/beta hydrolase [Chitinophaga ginsengisegetis]MDR6568365.1 alpha-beta hydrolase superfamily lysophospholipase [Chitinophaga ginsengisegetis]MDR6648404.1 alpha-beta hydrolase superfamily lysophospholipase [Chitinophaga ginsengisegetis]MDR6654446.1 alpha-beta hydrolase superfamily lysophospholipase [Chitinophaga ginsengisegetis]